VKLAQLLQGLAVPARDVEISDLTLDSRSVRAGSVFIALQGAQLHGLQFAAQAVAQGAAAIVWEPAAGLAPPVLPDAVVSVPVPQLAALTSELAARFFAPAAGLLPVTGVTGTNGKTTVAWLLAQAWTLCDRPAAYVGTLGTAYAGQHSAGDLTTPDAVSLQRTQAALQQQGAQALALEVSSHALVLGRVTAVRFASAVFTNLSHDHLDFHGTMRAYGEAKASLFLRADLPLAVINVDDAFGAQLLTQTKALQVVATSSQSDFIAPAGCDWLQACDIVAITQGVRFNLRSSFGVATVQAPLLGAFNVDNLLAVIGLLLAGGVALAQVVEVCAQLQAPPGRLQSFGGDAEPLVVVDYAHTPDALDKVLRVLRQHCLGRLWCVFGCGGDRDRTKRSQMGRIAAAAADCLIVTDDNPRSESPAAITADILAGVAGHDVRVIHDRVTAIATAVQECAANDLVLVAGKGHETVQIVGTERRPCNDADSVCAALRLRRAA
jgi:UDP-N-acetylmuramoyl-L-alanyl-D-glutamate--2,6-diaminopimelate ligase